ncbi:MAG: amino acid adenylation domain-containing protein [Chloroflexota bacterium]
MDGERPLRGIIFAAELDNTLPVDAADLMQRQQRGVDVVRQIVQGVETAAADLKTTVPKLWLVTRQAQPVQADDVLAVAQAPLWGFGKTIGLEHPKLWGGLLDLDEMAATAVFAEIWQPDGERQIAYRRGQRFVARLLPQTEMMPLTPASLRVDGAYLISGGLGALGLQVAERLVQQGARRLILLGRTPLPARREWGQVAPDSALGQKIAGIWRLEKLGASVHTAAVDVADAAALAAFLQTYQAEGWPAIRGVIHAAGLVQDHSLLQLDAQALTAVLRPKLQGGWLLHQLLADAPLDFFVLFSSAASLGGSPGQANYAAANSFLDALACMRQAQGLPALSINWGPWAGSGMAARADLAERRAQRGIDSISPTHGLTLLGHLLGQTAAQVGVMPATPEQLHALYPPDDLFAAGLSDLPPVVVPATAVDVRAALAKAAETERLPRLAEHLRQRIGQVLLLDAAAVPLDRNVMELGLDSIMVMELVKDLDQDLGLTLYPREIFERPSVQALAEYLLAEIEQVEGAAPAEVETAPAAATALPGVGRVLARPEAQNPGMVFLLSSPRAGSTLLRVMLAGHPGLFCPPELHLLPFNDMAEREAELRGSYLGEGLQRALMELLQLDAEQSAALLGEWAADGWTTQQMYGRLQELAAPRLLVDKSPSYAADAAVLAQAEQMFREAKYIHLVRHPYAVIDSFVKNRMDRLLGDGVADAYQLAEQVWTTMNSNILDFLEDVDPARHFLIHYEALVANPESVIRELCQFLGVPYDAAMLAPYSGERMTDGIHAASLSIGDPNFRKRQGIDPQLAQAWRTADLPRRLGGQARRLAAEFEYELPWPLQAVSATKTAVSPPKAILPADRQGDLPLSFAQQRLLFIDQYEPGLPIYNIPAAVRISGPLHVEALADSLTEIVQRHEALRTNFKMDGGAARQVIAPATAVSLPLTDLTHLSPDAREAEMERFVAESLRQPFDLGRDVKLRAQLFCLDETEHVLALTMHHIASDGWSIGVFLRELVALYPAFAAGEPSPLPDLPVQYIDYAQWQRAWVEDDGLAQQLAYWGEQLRPEPPVLELPTDRPRPAHQTYNGDRYLVQMSPELTTSLKKLGRDEGVTLFMTLLASFQALLYRYTGQTDITVGSPIAGRNRAEIRDLIGFFVNTLVLRANMTDDPTFRELLQQVRETALAAYANQDVPFEKLVEEVQPTRSLSHSPLFQVMLVLQNAPMPAAELPDLTLTPLDVNTGTAKFDLFLSLTDSEAGLNGWVEYNTDLFDVETVALLWGHYVTLLTAVTQDPARHLTDLPLLTEAERTQLLVSWNNTQVDLPPLALPQLIEAQVAGSPEAIAAEFQGKTITYAQLNGRANQLAHYLRSLGVATEQFVGVYMERSLDMLVGLLGILKAGGAYVPLDPAYPAARIAFILEDTAAPVLLTTSDLVETLPQHQAQVVCLDVDWTAVSAFPDTNPTPAATAANLAYVLHTSGSTGKPKGVQIMHGNVVNFLCSMRDEPGLTAQDALLAVTTLSFDISVLELFLPLSVGARIILVSRETATDAVKLADALETSGATVMQATPATWQLLLHGGWDGKPDLKILCGGEAMSRDLADQLLPRCRELWNMYGPTETTVWSAVYRVEPGEGAISIGHPISNTQIYLLDENRRLLPAGVPGELHIGGDGVARGYLNRPDLTAERFFDDLYRNKPGARLYKTGDRARYLPDGNIEFLGRIDHQVKIRGFRVELGEIESALTAHAALREAVVVAREDTPGDKRLVAYLILDEGAAAPLSGDLRAFLRDRLPAYMIPTAFVFMDVYPMTPNKKVDRKALPAPEQTRAALETQFVAPRNGVEEVVASMMAEVLRLEQVGALDSFFELGGHSLLATQLRSRVYESFQIDIPLRSFFAEPTVAGLANFLLTVPGQRARVEKTAQLLLKLAQMSDDQIAQMLQERGRR